MGKKVAVDINTIEQMFVEGRVIRPREVIDYFQKTGVLIYDSSKGIAPFAIQGEVVVIDCNSEEAKQILRQTDGGK